MIDAEVRSEERYSKLSLAYYNESEKMQINNCVDAIIAQYTQQPEIHTTTISNGGEVLVIEYHDDVNRESGAIFEQILQELNIKQCL
ncbi:hypothetical protein MNB_SM-3-1313 [hydrothermal vent metagenome]|uniref:Uncharacterized protein n=1 Tax=hydrothermal vent metagenome TaxID=652676 RepID=A0A1W1D5A9_9ZZZZ